MLIKKPLVNADDEHKELQRQKKEMSLGVNSLQLTKEQLEKDTKDNYKIATREADRAKELKLSNNKLETSLTAKKVATLALDNEYRQKEKRNNQYELDFQDKVAKETERIALAIPVLSKKYKEFVDYISLIKVDYDNETKNLSTLKKETEQIIANNKVLQSKKEDLAINIKLKEDLVHSYSNEITAQCEELVKNKTKIDSLLLFLSSINTKVESGKKELEANNKKIDDQRKQIKNNSEKIENQNDLISNLKSTVIMVNKKDKKLNDFAKFLQSKAKELGVNIKLD